MKSQNAHEKGAHCRGFVELSQRNVMGMSANREVAAKVGRVGFAGNTGIRENQLVIFIPEMGEDPEAGAFHENKKAATERVTAFCKKGWLL